MRKALFCFLIFFLQIAFASMQDVIQTKITSVNPKNHTIELEKKDLKIGESGWVYIETTDFGGIILQAEIIAVDKDGLIAKVKEYDAMKQVYLPKPTIKPKVGDKVIFRKLNKKAFLIVPTLEIYDQISVQHKEVEFLSPDLLLGYLYAYGGNDPTKGFLKSACNVYSVGLIYIVAKNELAILDCQSFKILSLQKFDTSSAQDPITPFYSRVDPVDTGTLFSLFADKKSKYYFSYYTSLIHPELSYQYLMLKEKPLVIAKELEKKKMQKLREEKLKQGKKSSQEQESSSKKPL